MQSRLCAEHAGYTGLTADEQFALFLEYVLHTDMRHYWIASLDTVRPWFVQVEHVEDISQPAKRRYVANSASGGQSQAGGSHNRLLKLMLFDGRQHHVAIEHSPVPFGPGWPRLGSKLVIDPGAVLREGVFLLSPGTCGVLGGAVDEFEARQRVFDEVLQRPVYGRRGPPLRLEAYMEGVRDTVREQIGASAGAAAGDGHAVNVGDVGGVGDGGRVGPPVGPPVGPVAVNASALGGLGRTHKRDVIESFEEDTSDDDVGDPVKRQRQDGSVTGVALLQTRPNTTMSTDDVVIDLLSSDDE